MTGRQENTNQKIRMELTLDLINARVSLTGQQRNQIREILREKFASAIEEEREACARLVELPTFIGLDDLAKAIRARKSKGD